MLSGGLTTTLDDADSAVLATDVAVTVTVTLDVTDVGVLYVAPVVVLLVNDPQAAPVQFAPAIVQLTPLSLESLDTVAVKASVCPWSSEVWAEGESATEIGRVLLLLLLLQP